MINSETSKAIASNTVYQLVGKIVSMSITILATIIITRMYGREGYGEFNLMQNFPALFFIIADFGLNAIATRHLSANWHEAKKYFGNILIMRSVISIVLMIACGIALIFFPYSYNLKIGIYLSLFLILTQALYATTNIVFQVKLRYDLSTLGYIFGSLAILILVLILSYYQISIIWVNFSYVVGGVLTFLANVYFIKKLNVSFATEIDFTLWKNLFIETLPIGLMFIFSQINFKADSILISVLKLPSFLNLNNTESVAVYGLPYKIFEVSLVFPTFFMNSTYPVLVRHMNESKERLKNTFVRVILFLFIAGGAAGIGGYIFAPLMIKILGGSDFHYSITVLRILLGGSVVFYMTQPIAWFIVTLGKQKYLPYIYLICAIFNVGANLVFIPKYSFYASAVITVGSELIILALLTITASKVWHKKYA